jgi:peptide/nickel transport system permease protein
MLTYIVRRVLMMIPMMLAITMFTFLVMHAAPGNAFDALLNPRVTDPDQLRLHLIHLNHLDDPLPVQYWIWLTQIVQGNFGNSFYYHQPVSQLLVPALRNTAIMAIIAEIFTLAVALPVGIFQSKRPYSKFDYTMSTGLFVLFSVPPYIFALFLIYTFALNLHWFPAQNAMGTGPGAGSLLDIVYHAILPAAAFALSYFAFYTRFVRSSMLEVSRKDFTRTAYAKGLSENKVFFKHMFRNGMIPVVTQFGLDIANIAGGFVILEGVFTYEGMGLLAINALTTEDYPLIMATTLIFAFLVLIGNLVADILYAVVDPRIKYN